MKNLTKQFNKVLGGNTISSGVLEDVLYEFCKSNVETNGVVELTVSQWAELSKDEDFSNAEAVYAGMMDENYNVIYKGFNFKKPENV